MSMCYPQTLPGTSIINNVSSSGPAAPACSKCTFGVANSIQHYGVTGIGSIKPIAVDDPASSSSSTLANRVGIEFFNQSAVEVEVSTQQTWQYGDGSARKIAAGAAWFVALGPAQVVGKHYVLAQSGAGNIIHVTETGA